MNGKIISITVLVIFLVNSCFSMEPLNQENSLSVFTISGIGGGGSDKDYVQHLLGTNIDVTTVQRPRPPFECDLGQNSCIKHLRKAFANNPRESIVHCTSQGTATTLNYLATEDKGKYIKAVIIEAALASGNSAILHSAKRPELSLRSINDLFASYYWLPYLAKCMFPFYWPAGKQPIKLVKDIPAHVPILIFHSKNDKEISYNDALALYYGLRSHNHNNVYLFSNPGARHVDILGDGDLHSAGFVRKQREALRTILAKKHNFPIKDTPSINQSLEEYQPDHNADPQFKKAYDELIHKENNHERLGYALMAGTAALLIKVGHYLYDQFSN